MKLRFYPRDGVCCYPPSATARRVGQLYHYIGRKATRGDDGILRHVAQPEPAEIDSDNADSARFVEHCRREALWAADADTARHCGVTFVPVEQDAGGEWVPAQPKKSSSRKDA